jgi:uncharacterized protein
MDITPNIPVDAKVIQSYGPEGFQISNEVYRHPVIVTPDRVLEWKVNLSSLSAADFELIQADDPPVEVILLGCGAAGMLLPSALRQAIRAMGFGIDAMSTGAACRTYNVMLSEGRRVAAAIVPG